MIGYVTPKPPSGYDAPTAIFNGTIATAAEMLGPDTHATQRMHELQQTLPSADASLLLWEAAGAQRWIKSGRVALFPTEEIVFGCKHTDALKSVTGRDVLTTYPSFFVTIPRSERWTNCSGSTLSHIIVNLYDGQTDIAARFGTHQHLMRMPNDRHILINGFWTDRGCQSVSVPLRDEESLADAFADVAADGPLDPMFKPPTLETSVDDEQIGWAMTEAVANMLLLMQAYPEYITQETVKCRAPGEKKAKGKATRLWLASPTHLRQQVNADPRRRGSGDTPETNRRPHLRRGHWRRQQHGAAWEIDHPDVSVVIMPGGEHAHMVRIAPCWIEKNQDKKEDIND
jgi:hypothetical protein